LPAFQIKDLKGTSKNPIFVTIPRYSKKLSLTYQIYAAFNFLLAPCFAWQRGKQASCEAAARKVEFLEAPPNDKTCVHFSSSIQLAIIVMMEKLPRLTSRWSTQPAPHLSFHLIKRTGETAGLIFCAA